ncbi:MAG TPA: ESPR-type extended signal peptide-containing protein, partial [Stenotrophomonas sp.]|nr:ESPR-type extended signal peptide-containing protein [Stenotrophomonas sp.]
MNRIYRKVWNKSLGMWTVASELARSDSPGVTLDRRVRLVAHAGMALGGCLLLAAALPAAAQSVEVGGNQNCIVLGGSILDSCLVDGSANASGTDAVAIGTRTLASGANSLAVGARASATATGAEVFGVDGSASGINSTGVGRQTNVIGENGVAVGYNTFVRESAVNGVAIGANAGATGADSVALGS